MTRIVTATLAILSLSACGPFLPTAGTWEVTEETVVEDGCNLEDEGDGAEGDNTFELEVDEEALALTFVFDESTSLDCTLDEMAFGCEPWTDSFEQGGATFTTVIEGQGVYSDEVSGTMTQTLTVTCEGDVCAAAEAQGFTFPCTNTYDLAAAYVGE